MGLFTSVHYVFPVVMHNFTLANHVEYDDK